MNSFYSIAKVQTVTLCFIDSAIFIDNGVGGTG